jgi:hypothetical protein
MRHVIGLNLFPAAWLLIAPLALPYLTNASVRWNDEVTGVVIVISTLALLWNIAMPWLWRTLVVGAALWLIVSPFMLHYPPARSGGDVLCGFLMLTVSGIEILEAIHHSPASN